MKKKNLFFALLLFVGVFSACKQESPAEYNDKIIAKQRLIVEKIDDLKKAIDDYNILPEDVAFAKMDEAYNIAVFEIDSAIAFLNTVEPFKDDASLKNAAIVLFTAYQDVVQHEYKQMIELYKLPDDKFKEEDAKTLDNLKQTSIDKLNQAFDNFVKVQKEFAEKNNLSIN
jgi:predicted metal-binding transcription factor (methanogenesis marker protein 9)